MDISIPDLIVWIVVGALAGMAAGSLLTRSKQGFGFFMNTVIGLIGAVIGGLIFNLLNIDLFPTITISLSQLIAAIIGAIILVLVWRLLRGGKSEEVQG